MDRQTVGRRVQAGEGWCLMNTMRLAEGGVQRVGIISATLNNPWQPLTKSNRQMILAMEKFLKHKPSPTLHNPAPTHHRPEELSLNFIILCAVICPLWPPNERIPQALQRGSDPIQWGHSCST